MSPRPASPSPRQPLAKPLAAARLPQPSRPDFATDPHRPRVHLPANPANPGHGGAARSPADGVRAALADRPGRGPA